MPIPDELPIMDIANDHNPIRTSFEVPTSIPVGKERARLEIAAAMRNAPAIKYGTYRPPQGPAKQKPRKVAANDNSIEVLPIIESLRRDNRVSDISFVLRYRLLCEVVGATPFDDEIGVSDQGINIQARSLRVSGRAFDKSFDKMTATVLPGGEISYREQRQTVKQRVSTGQWTIAANDNTDTRAQVPLRLAASEDERIARIDGQPILASLRRGIGDVLRPFEDAVLGGLTLTEIGDGLGFRWKARSAEAKWRVYQAIDRMRDQWRLINERMAVEAAACARRVEERRRELAAERTAFLGHAA